MNLLLLIEISHQQKLNLELAMEMITNSKELEKENDIKEVSFKNSYKMTPILIGSLCGRPSGKGEILKYEILPFGAFTLHMR